MNIVCIGAGYVGTVTAAAFAALGYKTTLIDIDQKKIDLINAGKSPIFEPGLDQLIEKYINKSLFAANSFQKIYDADVVFIAVGTPSNKDGSANLDFIKLAAKNIGEHLNSQKFTVIVNKSTVPVGTADLVASIVKEASGIDDNHFSVISNPEFLREGFALNDVFFPDRIIIGSNNSKASQLMKQLYEKFINRVNFNRIEPHLKFQFNSNSPKATYFETDTKSAEMIKYASNAFLAVKISYINEIARLCDSLGANVLDVSKGMGLDSRIGGKFLEASSGWSGSCFPKDTSEFLITSLKYGHELSLIKTAIQSNEDMHNYTVKKIQNQLKILTGKTIGILGLTFKPNTDDSRNTQAAYIIKKLISLGANIRVYDPKGMKSFEDNNPDLKITYCTKAEDIGKNADAIMLLTHWEEFLKLNWNDVYSKMKGNYLLDTRNFLNSEKLINIGFRYSGLGIGD
ncbi:UDP-glucose/GDP-mannose dehydrogenase family protein [Cytobacillus oceanisediminis]|uniref:UDP-glucose dehydrogenase family protein n=1 Tax=Cytobacillus oceanisediminis TaxID=665099 RepID=UPI0023DC546D|nr:UDP-glucose/GDP-mannose dehydrogenase family protein [Cytobacillus oceanisediminis]MDF2035798.1 UDP-glucose/GDP-mannose dehydrogenase family protein [Cytobacillus oceanisediminis]